MAMTYRLTLLCLGVLALTACSNRLNTSQVEDRIKADIERQGRRLTLADVRCPNNILQQEGASFRCVGELKPEGTFPINVVQQDASGTVEWDVPNSNSMLNLVRVEAKIQEGLTKALGKRATIDCGSEVYRPNVAGDRFECQVVGGLTVGSELIPAVLVKTEADGNLKWQEIRQPLQPVATSVSATASTSASTQPQGSSIAANTSSAPTANVKTTAVTGPTGRPINRPYVSGDSD